MHRSRTSASFAFGVFLFASTLASAQEAPLDGGEGRQIDRVHADAFEAHFGRTPDDFDRHIRRRRLAGWLTYSLGVNLSVASFTYAAVNWLGSQGEESEDDAAFAKTVRLMVGTGGLTLALALAGGVSLIRARRLVNRRRRWRATLDSPSPANPRLAEPVRRLRVSGGIFAGLGTAAFGVGLVGLAQVASNFGRRVDRGIDRMWRWGLGIGSVSAVLAIALLARSRSIQRERRRAQVVPTGTGLLVVF